MLFVQFLKAILRLLGGTKQAANLAQEQRVGETRPTPDATPDATTEKKEQATDQAPQQANIPAFVVRPFKRTIDSTLSKLYYKNEFICYILEDGLRLFKIQDKTAIFAGIYPIAQLRVGKFFNLYSKSFGHKFVPLLLETRLFTAILIHIGNTILDTRGCLLTGEGYKGGKDKNFQVTQSTTAYKRLHKLIEQEIQEQGKAHIQIIR
jgi:hypothetical protein